jgi:hypothetical protein
MKETEASSSTEQLSTSGVAGLKEYLNTNSTELSNREGKVPASAISAYIREFQKPRAGQQLNFNFIDAGTF